MVIVKFLGKKIFQSTQSLGYVVTGKKRGTGMDVLRHKIREEGVLSKYANIWLSGTWS